MISDGHVNETTQRRQQVQQRKDDEYGNRSAGDVEVSLKTVAARRERVDQTICSGDPDSDGGNQQWWAMMCDERPANVCDDAR